MQTSIWNRILIFIFINRLISKSFMPCPLCLFIANIFQGEMVCIGDPDIGSYDCAICEYSGVSCRFELSIWQKTKSISWHYMCIKCCMYVGIFRRLLRKNIERINNLVVDQKYSNELIFHYNCIYDHIY